MRPIRTVIVDDETRSRHLLRHLLESDCPETLVTGEAGSVAEAESVIRAENPDLLLLDVEMEDGTGFDLLDRFSAPAFQVIFTTAFEKFAVQAFRYCALDYLLKPINPNLLAEAVSKLSKSAPRQADLSLQYTQPHRPAGSRTFDRITLNTGDGLVFTRTDEIARLEANGNFTFVYMADGERHLVSRNLREFEEMLREPAFFRIHQSHIVNTRLVKKFLREDGGYAVLGGGNTKIPVARRRKEEFLAALGKEH